jgi:hypothetical protein
MATTTDASTGDDPFWWMRSWLAAPFTVPQQLSQPILPGWSFINVNETNSSAPDTELRILAGDSYGRQLGRILDAVCALVAERPPSAPQHKAFAELAVLAERIEDTKKDAAAARLKRVRDDLNLLKEQDPQEYKMQLTALKAALGI